MDGISGVGAGGGYLSSRPIAGSSLGAAGATEGSQSPISLGGNRDLSTTSAISSSSMSMNSESLNINSTSASNTNELLGAVLLALLLQFFESDDQKQKENMLGLIVGLAALQSMQEQSATSLQFSSSSLSIQSSELQIVSSESINNSYSGAGVDVSQVPSGDAASGGRIDASA